MREMELPGDSESNYELCRRALLCIDHSRAELAQFRAKVSYLRELLRTTDERSVKSESKRDSVADDKTQRRRA
jgi:hypothetical protein